MCSMTAGSFTKAMRAPLALTNSGCGSSRPRAPKDGISTLSRRVYGWPRGGLSRNDGQPQPKLDLPLRRLMKTEGSSNRALGNDWGSLAGGLGGVHVQTTADAGRRTAWRCRSSSRRCRSSSCSSCSACLRRPAWQASLAGLIVALVIAVGGLESAGRARAQFASPRRGVRALAGDVDRVQRDAALQHRAYVRAASRPSALWMIDTSAERPARRAGRDRLFASARCSKASPGFGTPVAITSSLLILRRLSDARSAHLHADLQHGAGRIRRARRADHRARRGHPPAGRRARRDGRPPVAVLRAPAAVLRDRRLCGLSQHAAACGRCCWSSGGELRAHAVRHVELHQLHADRRAVVARSR